VLQSGGGTWCTGAFHDTCISTSTLPVTRIYNGKATCNSAPLQKIKDSPHTVTTLWFASLLERITGSVLAATPSTSVMSCKELGFQAELSANLASTSLMQGTCRGGGGVATRTNRNSHRHARA